MILKGYNDGRVVTEGLGPVAGTVDKILIEIRSRAASCVPITISECQDKIYAGEVGVGFKIHSGIPLIDYDTLRVQVRQPTGKMVFWDGLVVEDGVCGSVRYISLPNDFPIPGRYLLSLSITFLDGRFYHGDIAPLMVYDSTGYKTPLLG